jgi:hypothetical protein
MQPFEIRPSAGGYDLQDVAAKFNKYGLIVLKGYFASDTRTDIRRILTEKLEDARAKGHVLHLPEYPQADFLLGDILSIRALAKYDYIFFKPELITVIKHVLATQELIYYGDSSTQFDQAARGFHKDHVERSDATTEDWIGDYGLIRCAFYCEDHARHSGGLKVRLKSHNVEACRSLFDRNRISHHAGRAWDVSSEYGDLVMWSMRLTHSGNYKKLRLLPRLVLHPRLETLLPASLALPEQERRYFMSCAFARPGKHFDHYLNNMLTRRLADYGMYLQRGRNAAESEQFLASRAIRFHKPCAFYGEIDTDLPMPQIAGNAAAP